MKRTKNFFIALLGFCLMGSTFVNAEVTDDGYVYQEYGGVFIVTGYNGKGTELVFPTINGEKVDVFFETPNLVQNSSSVEEVDLTNVRRVYKNAFITTSSPFGGEGGFLKLKKVKIGVDNFFEEGAFSVSTVTDLSFSSDVEEVTSSMVAPFKATVTNVDLTNVNSIGASAFAGCTNLTSIELKEVSTIGASAFAGSALKYIISNSVKTINKNAFSGCSSLAFASFEELTSLGDGAFRESGLSSFDVPSGLTALPANCFYSCKSLSQITLSNIQEIGNYAFYFCEKLTDVSFNNVAKIGDYAFQHSGMEGTLEFYPTLISLGTDAFGSTDLTGANFTSNPSGVNRAFGGSDVLTLNIGDVAELDLSNQNTYDKVVYTRTITPSSGGNRSYAGMMLPFTPDENDDYVYYRVNEVSSSEVSFVETTPTANTPYLFENLSASSPVEIVATGDVVVGGSDATIITDGYATGVYEEKTVDSYGKFYSIKGGAMTKYTDQLTVKPYRVYWDFSTVSSANFMLRTSRGGETAIDFMEIDNEQNLEQNYYDLTGRKVLNPVKGNIYIVKGKKVVF